MTALEALIKSSRTQVRAGAGAARRSRLSAQRVRRRVVASAGARSFGCNCSLGSTIDKLLVELLHLLPLLVAYIFRIKS